MIPDILSEKLSTDQKLDSIKQNLRNVYDPEISVNIYDLGLIYNIDITDDHCDILMSLTSAWCPSADDITQSTQQAALAVSGIKTCFVKVTFDPQWGPHMMSEEAKLELNLWDMDVPVFDSFRENYDYLNEENDNDR